MTEAVHYVMVGSGLAIGGREIKLPQRRLAGGASSVNGLMAEKAVGATRGPA